ncbi:MAG: thymidylate synthase [Lachnospiraceae bacterium]|nr:thymidylate synthase [Lachnospiraceae bacterium]
MNKADHYMLEGIHNILENGYKDVNPRPKYADGTPAHTISVNHVTRTYDISKGEFPVTSLRHIAWKSAIKEILWIYQDATSDLEVLNNKYGVHYWNDWESKDVPGTIGHRYGYKIKKEDSINKLIRNIQQDPYGRRKIINLWDETDFRETDGLFPCAFLTMWNVRDEYLDMMLVQRSGDMMAASGGGGINEFQYAALLMMIARHTGYQPGVFTHVVANEQIYDRHIEVAEDMLKRGKTLEEREDAEIKPMLVLNTEKKDFFAMTIDDFELKDYNPVKPNYQLDLGI